jgi:hypothetical protein
MCEYVSNRFHGCANLALKHWLVFAAWAKNQEYLPARSQRLHQGHSLVGAIIGVGDDGHRGFNKLRRRSC